ncbi:MAG: response regulator transcription factor [candidate division Zixibacteria bacterium]|nr:response regulator transcription factor [candidate division Zixibacteria bacterium]
MQSLRILLVDDSRRYVEWVTQFLIEEKFSVISVASDGAEAVGLAKALHPDVILLDIAMRGMSGLEALPLLRRVAPEARILMVTLYDNAATRKSAMESCAAGFISKALLDQDLIPVLYGNAPNGPKQATADLS